MSRSRSSKKPHSTVEDAVLRPAMAELQIAPIRSPADHHNAPRSMYSSSTTLPPLRTLEPQPRFNPLPIPATLEPPRDPQPSSYSASAFQQPRHSSKSSRHQSSQHHSSSSKHHSSSSQHHSSSSQHHSSSSKHRSRHDSNVSSSSSGPSSTTSSRRSGIDPRHQPRSYTHEYRADEEEEPVQEYAWRERPPTSGSSYSPEEAPYPTPRHSTTDYSDKSADAYSSPSSAILQSPARPQSTFTWALNVRQQPRAARACGFGERDRRVIDPPPVVQLHLYDPSGRQLDATQNLNSMMVMHVSLWNEAGTEDCTLLEQPGRRPGGRLMGTMMATATVVTDENDDRGVFFAFPDLSCRSYGKYRLRFVLMSINPIAAATGSASPVLAHAMSDVFEVYAAKTFPGMKQSTPLTGALKRQGVAIPVKKGKLSSSRRGNEQDDDDDDDD